MEDGEAITIGKREIEQDDVDIRLPGDDLHDLSACRRLEQDGVALHFFFSTPRNASGMS